MEQVTKHELTAFEEGTSGKKNGTINVLTILTFIGCAIQLIIVFLSKWFMSFAIRMADNPEAMEKMSTKEKAEMFRFKEIYEVYVKYEMPIIAMSLIGIALCFWGALQMRKLKKQGYYAYLVGEWMPLIGSTALMGISLQFNGIGSTIFALGVPLLFSILYGLQLKRM